MSAVKERLPILVVDDDEPTQKLLQAVLRRSGLQSDVASNGAEAIKLIESRPYSAVILDVMMPSVSGRQVVDFLATKSEPVPVIVCSAASVAALKDFDARVVKAVVRKPFDVEQLMAMIDIVTAGR